MRRASYTLQDNNIKIQMKIQLAQRVKQWTLMLAGILCLAAAVYFYIQWSTRIEMLPWLVPVGIEARSHVLKSELAGLLMVVLLAIGVALFGWEAFYNKVELKLKHGASFEKKCLGFLALGTLVGTATLLLDRSFVPENWYFFYADFFEYLKGLENTAIAAVAFILAALGIRGVLRTGSK